MGLEVDEYVDVIIAAPQDHLKYVERMLDYVKREVRARTLKLTTNPEEARGEHVRSWEVSGGEYRIAVSRAVKGSAG